MPYLSSSEKGKAAELAIMSALARKGKAILVPFGEYRYDFVIDEGDGKFSRVQCKTAVLKKGALTFYTASRKDGISHGANYVGEIEYFGIYSFALDKVYLIPIEVIGTKKRMSLRVDEPRNRQKGRIHWASEYEV